MMKQTKKNILRLYLFFLYMYLQLLQYALAISHVLFTYISQSNIVCAMLSQIICKLITLFMIYLSMPILFILQIYLFTNSWKEIMYKLLALSIFLITSYLFMYYSLFRWLLVITFILWQSKDTILKNSKVTSQILKNKQNLYILTVIDDILFVLVIAFIKYLSNNLRKAFIMLRQMPTY